MHGSKGKVTRMVKLFSTAVSWCTCFEPSDNFPKPIPVPNLTQHHKPVHKCCNVERSLEKYLGSYSRTWMSHNIWWAWSWLHESCLLWSSSWVLLPKFDWWIVQHVTRCNADRRSMQICIEHGCAMQTFCWSMQIFVDQCRLHYSQILMLFNACALHRPFSALHSCIKHVAINFADS